MAFTALAKTIPFTFSLKFNDLCHDLLQEYDYIFYISPDGIDIEDNGVRTTDPEYRKSVNKKIKKNIKEKKGYIKNLIELNGSVEERVNKVKQTLSL